jgi:hypothetical protein
MFLALRPLRWHSWTAGPFTPDARHLHRYRRRQLITQRARMQAG